MPARHEPAPVAAGRLLGGRYRLVRLIAKGGMAEVWEGHDEILARAVAVKVLHPHLAGDGLFLERFRREAVSAAGLAHPGVVSTFDTGVDDGTAFIVMELVKGRNVRQYLRDEGALPAGVAVELTRQVADVLAHAHKAGLIHRDVKPANLLLVEDGSNTRRVKVTDFGIAKAGAVLSELTRTGTVLGTPKYLAPEQVRGEEPDPRSDLYSLGVVLFEMLTAEPPFRGDTDMATALAHLNEPVPKLTDRGVHVAPALETIVEDLLAKDRAHRVQSADDLLRRLDSPDAPGNRPSARPSQNGGPVGRTGPGRAEPTSVDAVAGRRSPSGGSAGGTADGSTVSTRTAAAGGVRPGLPPVTPRSKGSRGSRGSSGSKGSKRRGIGGPTLVVGLVAVIAAVVVVVTVGVGKNHRNSGRGTTAASADRIVGVTVWMANSRSPDNPGETKYTFDGNASTYWETDSYSTPTFGGLYPGIGLAIHLQTAAQVHRLTVTSASQGWSAQAYVSSNPVPSGRSVTAWGPPRDTQTGVSGNAAFNLGGAKAGWVLLWLTNLGQARQVIVNEVAVS